MDLHSQPWAISSSYITVVEEPFAEGETAVVEYFSTQYSAQPISDLQIPDELFLSFIKLLERLRHPNIIQFIGVVFDEETKKPIWLLYELLDWSLYDVLYEESDQYSILDVLD